MSPKDQRREQARRGRALRHSLRGLVPVLPASPPSGQPQPGGAQTPQGECRRLRGHSRHVERNNAITFGKAIESELHLRHRRKAHAIAGLTVREKATETARTLVYDQAGSAEDSCLASCEGPVKSTNPNSSWAPSRNPPTPRASKARVKAAAPGKLENLRPEPEPRSPHTGVGKYIDISGPMTCPVAVSPT
jgi:hypothetical protein